MTHDPHDPHGPHLEQCVDDRGEQSGRRPMPSLSEAGKGRGQAGAVDACPSWPGEPLELCHAQGWGMTMGHGSGGGGGGGNDGGSVGMQRHLGGPLSSPE